VTEKLKLDLSLLLPDMEAGDRCITFLTDHLNTMRGIEEAHIVRHNGTAEVCIHYDPNLVPLARVERLARQAGGEISERYQHDTMPFSGLNTADAAWTLEQALASLEGVLHANVNYAAGLISVAYDTQIADREQIQKIIRRYGVRIVPPKTKAAKPRRKEHEKERDHAHGSTPSFLPHWVQELWTLLLVGIAGITFLIGWTGQTFWGLSESVALMFFVTAYIAGGYDIAIHALPGLLKAKFDTDVLMLAAAGGAALLGEWTEGAFLLFLFSLGHAGEHYALDRARSAMNALGEMMPQTARVKRDDRVIEVPVAELQIDDVVLVRPGDRVPVDGEVSQGTSSIDQSPITGESVPVAKQPGDEVFAGTINQEAALEVKVRHLAQDNMLSRVMEMVAEAQSQQSPTQQFTQRFTARFVPAVLLGTVLFIVIPPLAGWMPLGDSFYRGLLLLVAASPCALAIGTPAAVLSGIAQAARNGVLVKGGVHLENLGRLNVIAFDKTGTLTKGEFEVTDTVPLNSAEPQQVLRLAASVEQQSNHPLALAVVRAAEEQQLALPPTDGMENIPGRGINGVVDGAEVYVGSLKLFRENGDFALSDSVSRQVTELESNGRTTMVVGKRNELIGVLGLADTVRENASEVMQHLKDIGARRLVMLTGDNDDVARQIASQIGVTDVRAELLPEDKLAVIRELEKEYESIAMVGDGVNDAPALATATVGIAMGGAGTAVALETADVALMADDLSRLPFAVGLSRASRQIIQQNLTIALGIIGLLIVTSVLSIVPLSGAVVLHEGSTIVVVLNALRLLGYRGMS
jgi:Cd2+/Zn2+-exporting ATPase